MNRNGKCDEIIEGYSEQASAYDEETNQKSCWDYPTRFALNQIQLRDHFELVVDVGCGTGHALQTLAGKCHAKCRLVGVEPAKNMRLRARSRLKDFSNVSVIDGRFEVLPIVPYSVDYLFSILAFHWTTDPKRSVEQIARVLKPDGAADLFFTGRKTGREFTRRTNPICLKLLGSSFMLDSAKLRQQFTAESAQLLFGRKFKQRELTVSETTRVYYDDLQGHWSWWISRMAGHFRQLSKKQRYQFDREIREAIAACADEKGIPYTVHLIHIKIRRTDRSRGI